MQFLPHLSGRDMRGAKARTTRRGSGPCSRPCPPIRIGRVGGRSRHRPRGQARPGDDHADLYRLPGHPGDQRDIRAALDGAGYAHVTVETVLAPPWTTDWISDAGKAKLLAYGIAPPVAKGERAVHCPQCGSGDTEEISRFGSTPCKALWRCRACAEPFDLFKCH